MFLPIPQDRRGVHIARMVTAFNLAVTDAKNQTTIYTYDPMDRLATRKDALNRTESYQYDVAGNLSQFTDRKNQVTTFTYDALNRRIGASYADGSSTAFIYDAVGRLTKAMASIMSVEQLPARIQITFGGWPKRKLR